MKKKLLLVFIILVLFSSAGITYLNRVILPVKIKSLIIDSLKEQTQKEVSLQSIQFSIFKGLVLRGLVIYDDKETIVNLKEGSCAFLILAIFKGNIIIPALRLKSLEVFLERRKDNTFNLQELFPQKAAAQAQEEKSTPPLRRKGAFRVSIYRVNVTDATIRFQDNTFAQPFNKNIEHLNLNLYLSLPASVKFNLKAQIKAAPVINLGVSGEFKIPAKQLTADIAVRDFSPQEFLGYYQGLGVSIPEGLINALIRLELKDNILRAGVAMQNKNLTISKDKVSVKLNSDIKADIQYSLEDKQVTYSGKAAITDSRLSGLGFIGTIDDISGEVEFNTSGLSSDKLSASIFAVPVQAKVDLNDFKTPLLNMNIISGLSLASIQNILKDEFKLTLPAEITGQGNLSLSIQSRIPPAGIFQISGYLDVLNATVKLERINSPIEEINGRLEFNQAQLKWSGLNLKYLGIPYKTTGVLTNFQAPGVQLELFSQGLSLQSDFAVNNKVIKLSKFAGRYLNSEFSITGDIDARAPADLETDLRGRLKIDLQDTGELLKKFKNQLEQIKPEGVVEAQLHINGNIGNIKSCAVTAGLSSPSMSAYGLKAKEFILNYNQDNGIIDIALIHLSMYEGTIEARASMNLNSANLPYTVTADMQGVKVEQLKLDTAARGKDIAGTLQAQIKLNGFYNDISKLTGAGNIFISEGKLWQLNLFQGLGSLLFARDFANIIFNEGSCGFSIRDNYIFTDNLILKSNIADLSGSVKVGLDSSIDASLNVKVLDESAPLSGTFKDITTAIIGQAGRFGVIKVSGTLEEPKFKFQPAVVDIIKGLKDAIFGK